MALRPGWAPATAVAQRLAGWLSDSGAMYRITALCRHAQAPPIDVTGMQRRSPPWFASCQYASRQVRPAETTSHRSHSGTEEVGMNASRVSALSASASRWSIWQHSFRLPGLVADGAT